MTSIASTKSFGVRERALKSLGSSNDAIYRAVTRLLRARHAQGDLIVDVGCGTGRLRPFVCREFRRYLGVDTIQYRDYPPDAEFCRVEFDSEKIPLADASADVVASIETIEHLENPRAFFRELVRVTKPGGWVIVTTPNQLSCLSLLTLILKRQFSAFQENSYPAHITALLEIDLRRIAKECGLANVEVAFTEQGRIVLTPVHYPTILSKLFPRACSDNLLLIGNRLC